MRRLWFVPTYAIVTFIVLGPLLAYTRVLPPLAGFSLIILAVFTGIVFGMGFAAAAAYASVTNKSWRPVAVRAAVLPLIVGLGAIALTATSKVPAIHDITTDFQDRPEFTPDVAAASPNKDAQGDDRTRIEGMQKTGYPDVRPIQLQLPPDQAFAKAKAVAEAMPGWQVTNADMESGRIEATATSKIFHFVDDIVIRVRADGSGSRVDVRSRSRVGQSDLGANAARIRAYGAELTKAS